MSRQIIEDPYVLLQALDQDKQIKINSHQFNITRQGIIYDVYLQQYKLYANQFYHQNVRNGNSYIQLLVNGQVQSTSLARKGMKKFFKLQRDYIDNIKSNTEVIHDIIFNDIKSVLSENRKIKIYQMVKASGENAQVSYQDHLSCWLIASKNVSLLARHTEDIKQNYSASKYDQVRVVAQVWFDLLKRVEDEQGHDTIVHLQRDLTNRTIIGQYCDIQDPIIKYDKVTLSWYSLVEHNSKDDCIDIQTSQAFFKHYQLDTLLYKDLGTFSHLQDIKSCLLTQFDRVSGGSIQDENQGSVITFELQPLHNEYPQVLSHASIETLEYKIFQKLREKLLTYINEKESKCSTLIKKFTNEVEQLCKNNKSYKPLSYYNQLAEAAFDFAYDFPTHQHFIQQQFETFLSVVQYSVSNKIKVNPKDFQNNQKELPIPAKILKSKKRYIIPVFSVGIPGMGKSTLFHSIQNLIMSSYGDVNVSIISNDKLRAYLLNAEQDKSPYKLPREELFRRTAKEVSIRYWKEIDNQIQSFNNDTTFNTFFMLLDKNMNPQDLESQVKEFKKRSTQDVEILSVGIIPDCYKVYEKGGIKLPFSLNFLMTCIGRVQNRVQHETLQGDGVYSLGVMSLFIKLFEGQELNCNSLDHKISFQYVRDNQGSDKQYDNVCEKDFADIVKKTTLGDKCADKQLLEDFLDSFNHNKPKDTILDEDEMTVRASELVKSIITKFNIETKPKLKRRQSDVHKQVHVQFSLGLERHPMYLGIFIDPQDNDEINSWVCNGLREAQPELGDQLLDIENEFLDRRFKHYHITTLFIGNNFNKSKNHPAYVKFELNKKLTMGLDYFVAIQDHLLVIVMKKQDMPIVADRIPHITAYTGQFSPKDSNEVLQLVSKPSNRQPFLSTMITINGKRLKAFTIWPSSSKSVRGITKEHYDTKNMLQDE